MSSLERDGEADYAEYRWLLLVLVKLRLGMENASNERTNTGARVRVRRPKGTERVHVRKRGQYSVKKVYKQSIAGILPTILQNELG